MGVTGTVLHRHRKISGEYITKKSWSVPYSTHTNVSAAHTIKNCWLKTKTSAVYADKNHTKIGCEYTTIKALVED